jgi:hypothetical protein
MANVDANPSARYLYSSRAALADILRRPSITAMSTR